MIDKRWSDRQWSKVVTGVVKAITESATGTMQGRGRQQTEKISTGEVREAGSKRSEEEVNSPGSARKDKLGNTLGNVARGKQDFALGECLCAAFM